MLAAALLLPLSGLAQVNTIPSAPHLLVKGHAEGHYIPDRFSVELRVVETDMVPDKARTLVEQHMQQIFTSLQKNHAIRQRTIASSLQINPDVEYRDQRSVFIGTTVSRTVHATFSSLDGLRGFLTQLQASETVQVIGTKAERSDIDKIRLALRQRAMANSRQAAKEIAASYGMTIVGIYSVSEVAPNFAYGIQAGTWENPDARDAMFAPPAPPPDMAAQADYNRHPDADLRAGTIDVQRNIYAIYLIKP
ncbi:MAG TPA: SIMPL domain-containing protein [Rhodanobacter sp.]|nr:SIMPL domain-containing protein [Rhodanobacter sp.]